MLRKTTVTNKACSLRRGHSHLLRVVQAGGEGFGAVGDHGADSWLVTNKRIKGQV